MDATEFPRPLRSDLQRVTETLEMLAPRWSVWTLATLTDQPQRYTEIKPQLAMLEDGQLAPRLARLTADGLVERQEHHTRYVAYRLTRRGQELRAVCTALAAYGETHLDDAKAENAGGLIPPAQNAEDVLALLTPKHATPLLWALRLQQQGTGRELAALLGKAPELLYHPLRRLVDDGLVERSARSTYQLSATGVALSTPFRTLSAWAAGRSAATVHPLWTEFVPHSRADLDRQWAATRSTSEPPVHAPRADAVLRPRTTAWIPSDLFSEVPPAQPAGRVAAGGRTR
ncbi:winged helix-turn-helix transcriptional regulator [Streptomyces sp. NPDC051561]|uniref:winged helix-turn-helix transcriptional regulator n=1 Tax=Streptomyces sp. NPDC051561 TaxID=3365658 RepID=UPI003792DB4C